MIGKCISCGKTTEIHPEALECESCLENNAFVAKHCIGKDVDEDCNAGCFVCPHRD